MSILPLLFLSLPLAVVHATDPRAPDTFQVNMTTDVPGTVTLNITRAQAPHGADHFYALVQDNFFDNAAFFRVVPQFVAQFGIAGIPKENTKWEHNIPDDRACFEHCRDSNVCNDRWAQLTEYATFLQYDR